MVDSLAFKLLPQIKSPSNNRIGRKTFCISTNGSQEACELLPVVLQHTIRFKIYKFHLLKLFIIMLGTYTISQTGTESRNSDVNTYYAYF